MEISKIYVAKSSGGVSVGYGSVTFDDTLIVRFSIMKSSKDGKLFVNWPSKKGKDDKWYPDVSFVVDESADNPYENKNTIDSAIIKEFNKVIGTVTSSQDSDGTDFDYGKNESSNAPEPKEKKPLVSWGNKKK